MKNLVIAIDIGGTFTKFGIADRTGNLYAEGTFPTSSYSNVDTYIDRLVHRLKNVAKEIKEPCNIVGIGIGAPNGNYHKGTIEDATNLEWKGIVPFVEKLKKYYDLPIKLTNDANAAAIGEMIYGDAKHIKDFIMITLGTGLGSGIVVNGELVYGHDGFAGEIGHVNVKKNGRKCGCGNYGCLETYVSAPGIKRTVFELLALDHEESELANYTYNELTAEMIYEAAKRNDSLALKAFELTGEILGSKLADSVAHTSPKAIFLFGGLSKAGNFIFNPTIKHLQENLMVLFKDKIKVLPSGLMGKNAAILGAAALIWKEL